MQKAGSPLSALLSRVSPTSEDDAGTTHSRRADIQGLRALAVLLVVLNHAHVPLCQGGYEGVDVFFVISGYVITQRLRANPDATIRQQLVTFYSRRIRRIVPAATVALLFTLVIAVLCLRSTFPPNLIGDVRWATLFGENARLTDTSANYFIPGLAPSLVTQFWSLAVEEQFYIVFPLVFFATTFIKDAHRRLQTFRHILCLVVVASALWSGYATAHWPIAAYYSPFTRMWELGLGALLAVIPQSWRWRSPRAAVMASLAAVTLIFIGLMTLTSATAYPGFAAWLPCAAIGLLLFTGRAQQYGPVQHVLSLRPLQFIGDISYAWYLFHYVWLTLPLYLGSGSNGPLNRVVEVAMGFGCAVLAYVFVENPVRRSPRFSQDPWMVALLLIGSIALVMDATLIIQYFLPPTL